MRYVWGATMTGYRYTGQRMEGTGLYDYGGGTRWYDPMLGRFTQPDSVVPLASQGVQAWDRYAFVSNNPLRYTDPTGHVVDSGCQTEGCSGNSQAYVRSTIIGMNKIVAAYGLSSPEESVESSAAEGLHHEALRSSANDMNVSAIRAADAISAISAYGVMLAQIYGYHNTRMNVFFLLTTEYNYEPGTSDQFAEESEATVKEMSVWNNSSGTVSMETVRFRGDQSPWSFYCVDCGVSPMAGNLTRSGQIVNSGQKVNIPINYTYPTRRCWARYYYFYKLNPDLPILPEDYLYMDEGHVNN